jgi:hypothetical protein
MAVIELTSVAEAISPRRRRARGAASKIGGGIAVLIPIVALSSFITYCLGALSDSNPAATILGQDAATPAAVLPGLGQLLLEAAQTRDIPVVQGVLLVVATFVVVVNLVVVNLVVNTLLNLLYRTSDGISA